MAERVGKPVRDAVAEAHVRLLADHRLQFAFSAPPPERKPPAWLIALVRWLAALGRRTPHGGAPAWTPYLPWLLLFVVVAGVLVLLARGFAPALARRRARRTAPMALTGRESWRPDALRAQALLEDADGLARQGRFADAAHALLFRSIADLEVRVPTGIAASLTSRDIAALPDLPQTPRAAFARIAAIVEHSVFGEAPLGPSEWTSCREAYTRFAFDAAWTVA